MPDYDFRTQRLFVDVPFIGVKELQLDRDKSHYLVTVLRLKSGDPILIFNGRDGEWLARIIDPDRKVAVLSLVRQVREQPQTGDIDYIFAPLKHARLDYLVQKSVEMGVNRIIPVITRHTQISRINLERMRANTIEAAEQCGVLAVPELCNEAKLDAVLDSWDPARTLIFCDERASDADPISVLKTVQRGPVAVLIGPEGGFSNEEREQLLRIPSVIRLSLGPRILRADTAAVAALALVQAVLGDWARE